MSISTAELRRRIIKEHGVTPHRVPYYLPEQEPYDETSVDFHKTPKMKYIEIKCGILLKNDIYLGSLNEVCSRYGWEVDRSTVSRWRKVIRRYIIRYLED